MRRTDFYSRVVERRKKNEQGFASECTMYNVQCTLSQKLLQTDGAKVQQYKLQLIKTGLVNSLKESLHI